MLPARVPDTRLPNGSAELWQLLARVEELSRELGSVEIANAELNSALDRLEARLLAVGVTPGLGLPLLEPASALPIATDPPLPPRALARLVARMEALGLALGRADINPDEPPDAAPIWSASPPRAERGPASESSSNVVQDEPAPVNPPQTPQVAALRPARATSDEAAAAMRLSLAELSVTPAPVRPIEPTGQPAPASAEPLETPPAPSIAAQSSDVPEQHEPAPEVAEDAEPAASAAVVPPAVAVAPPPGGGPPRRPFAERWRRRGRWSQALALGVLAVALLAALAVVMALADSGSSSSTPTPTTSAANPQPPATLAPVNGSDTRVPGVYGYADTPTPVLTATPSPTATATPVPTRTPTPRPTATRTPSPTPTPTPTSTPTPEPTPTPTPEPPPPTPTPVNPTPGLGATRADVETRLGPPGVTRANGVVEYQNGTITVRYSNEGRVLWMSLNQRLTGNLSREAADAFASAWRPPDAVFQNTALNTPALEREIFASAGVTAALGGGDVRGRNPNVFVEEFERDPANGNILSITLAVGNSF
jgi:hypothetical protein